MRYQSGVKTWQHGKYRSPHHKTLVVYRKAKESEDFSERRQLPRAWAPGRGGSPPRWGVKQPLARAPHPNASHLSRHLTNHINPITWLKMGIFSILPESLNTVETWIIRSFVRLAVPPNSPTQLTFPSVLPRFDNIRPVALAAGI